MAAVQGSVGENIKTKVEGNKLFIEVDLSKDLGPSASGKSIRIATSEGNQSVPGAHSDIRLGFNLYRRNNG